MPHGRWPTSVARGWSQMGGSSYCTRPPDQPKQTHYTHSVLGNRSDIPLHLPAQRRLDR